MEKRYQVFVSSTFTDLIEERQNVMQALLELDCIPAGMELFSASDADQWSLIQEVINDCDYYIVIIGGRYGSTTVQGISFTEKEFDYAVSVGKPVLAFLHQNPEDIPAGKTEIDPEAREKLLAFRQMAQTDRVCKYWSSPEDLGGKVSRALVKVIKKLPAEGWVRGRFAATTDLLNQINDLKESNEKLKADLMKMGEYSPEGAEQYAGGSDLFSLRGYKEVGENKTVEDWEITLTWDQIFSLLGPVMYEDVNEKWMQDKFSTMLREHCGDAPGQKIHTFRVSDESFQSVKIQLLALGLIMTGVKQDLVATGVPNWRLTPYGETYLLKLKAIKKKELADLVESLKTTAIKKTE